jgi:hypothetical protein
VYLVHNSINNNKKKKSKRGRRRIIVRIRENHESIERNLLYSLLQSNNMHECEDTKKKNLYVLTINILLLLLLLILLLLLLLLLLSLYYIINKCIVLLERPK